MDINKIKSHIPAFISILDIADYTRRSAYLGYKQTSSDLETLEKLLKKYGKKGFKPICFDSFKRVICVFSSEENLYKLVSDYYLEDSITIGLKSQSELKGKKIESEKTKETKILRALSCIYEYIDDKNNIEYLVNEMLKLISSVVPNIPTRLKDKKNDELNEKSKTSLIESFILKWNCIESPLKEFPRCLFCQSDEFEWIDGGSISGYGICVNCNAEYQHKYY